MRIPRPFSIFLSLLLPASAADLVHRYSFDTDASDSVGNADGILNGDVSISGGQAVFTGDNDDNIDLGDQIEIGANFGTTGITVEAWYTDDDSSRYAKLFGFGDNNEAELFGFTHSHSPTSSSRVELPSTNGNGNAEPGRAVTGVEHHLVMATEANGTTNVWIDGVQVVTNHAPAEILPLSSVSGGVEQLGNSAWPDPSHKGTINEFRIWSGTLNATEVAQHLAAGPDSLEPPSTIPLPSHRYSFTTDATDSIGTADLSLAGAASVTGGLLDLPGAGGATGVDYAFATGAPLTDLEATINNASVLSVEIWFDIDELAANDWAKMLMAGDPGIADFIDFTPRRAGGSSVTKFSINNGNPEISTQSDAYGPLETDTTYYMLVTWNPISDQMELVIGRPDGVMKTFTGPMGGRVYSSTPLSRFQIGTAAGFFGDPDLNGQVDEFRLWNSELTADQKYTNFTIGADDLPDMGDSDGDGLPDGYEQAIIDADPADDIVDLEDVAGPNDAPTITDFDNDGSSDANEFVQRTSPRNPDTDGDLLLDGVESGSGEFVNANDTGTDPTLTDTDGDGFSDKTEVDAGSDPNDIASVPSTPVTLNHRYSFNDVTDSVGGADGLLLGNATISEGKLHTTGSNADAFDLQDQIEVGSNYTEEGITIEAWYTDNNSPQFAKVFGLGDQAGYFAFTHSHAPPTQSRVDFPGSVLFDRSSTGVQHHLVVALSPDGVLNTWVDGIQVITANATGNPISSIAVGGLQTEQIGNAAWNDPSHIGTFDEFRIWSGLFNSTNVSSSYAAGPDVIGAYPDNDSDGLPNFWETANGLDPDDSTGDNGAAGDPDEDNSSNLDEYVNGTDPQDEDSDDDHSNDGNEAANHTDPLDNDSDDDGLWDGWETNTGIWVNTTNTGTDPLDPDSDDDGIPDGLENPDLPHIDSNQPGTDPNKADSDDDGFQDQVELNGGSDPTDAQSQPDSGIGAPGAFAPFSGGAFPSAAPGTGTDYTVVESFPELPDFDDPMFMLPYPGTNDLLMIQKRGDIVMFENDPEADALTPFLDIRSRVFNYSDCGMTGIVFHPDFNDPTDPQRYVFVTYKWNPRVSVEDGGVDASNANGDWAYLRLSRFEVPAGGSVADPDSEVVLVQQFDRQMFHDAGCMIFAPDGYLYFSVGDEGGEYDQFDVAQKIDNRLFSGIFRIDVDNDPTTSHPIRRQPLQHEDRPADWPPSFTANYSIPNDNPFNDDLPYTAPSDVLEEYYALGLRQPYRFSQDPVTGLIWIGESGQVSREEVDILEAGANYQWPYMEGDISHEAPPENIIGTEKSALWDYDRTQGGCLIGGYVYRGSRLPGLVGRYIAVDNVSSNIWAVDSADGITLENAEQLGTMRPGSVYGGSSSCAIDQYGEIHFVKLRGDGGGRIWTLATTGTTPEPPALLSETGLFTDLATLTPAPGVIPYHIEAPLWSDNAKKARWIAVPSDGTHDTPAEKITFSANDNWQFPTGTITIKHFELPIDDTDPSVTVRLETRVIVCTEENEYYAVTYRWNPEQTDATLLIDSETQDYTIQEAGGGSRQQEWYFPSRSDCRSCHTTAAGQALGVRTQHFNHQAFYPSTNRTANQLQTFSSLGIFDRVLTSEEISNMVQSRAIDDETAPLAVRVRSYLDSNCSHCHRPGGGIPGFDARITTPLVDQGIINGHPGQFGVLGPDSRYVVPGDVPMSIIHHRMNAVGNGAAMPPLAKNVVDEKAVQLVADWISSLTPSDFVETDGERPERTELAGPSGVINGPFEVTLALDHNVSEMTPNTFAATGGTISGLRGGVDYYVATIDPDGAPTVTVQLPTDALTGPGDPPLGSLESETVVLTYVSASDGYVDWANDHQLSGAGAGLTANPAGDGIANTLKYAFNLDPNHSDIRIYNPAADIGVDGPFGLPRIVTIDQGNGELRLEVDYIRRKDSAAEGFNFTVQFSGTLNEQPWSDHGGPETVESLNDTWERVSVVDTVTSSSVDRRFGRVGVLYTPPVTE